MKQPNLDRRELLVGSAGMAAAFALPGCGSTRYRVAPRPPDALLRVAVVGLNGRGRDHLTGFSRLPNVQVVALCDVDEHVLARELGRASERGLELAGHRDVRELLERGELDAISIATPNHWHALAGVWACQAGVDVYVEKPVSHEVWEGRQLVNAARKYARVVQAGTQSRSSQGIRDAIAWMRSGQLGRVLWAQGLCYKPRQSIGRVDGPQPVPDGVDYDQWCGPAPRTPLMRKRLHYDWHWVQSTGNGDLGNQGIHQMDLCRWALGENGLPRSVRSVGGRVGYDDDGDTPNTQFVVYDYPSAPLVFEVRGLPRDKAAQEEWREMDRVQGTSISALIHCEGGTLRIPSYQSAVAVDPSGAEIRRWEGASDHYANFAEVVRSRRVEDLNADVEQGHVSSALCHLGGMSHWTGALAGADSITAAGADDARFTDALARMREHLARNEVDLDRTPLVLGRPLRIDPQRESIVDDREAAALLRRDYRDPYRVPERV